MVSRQLSLKAEPMGFAGGLDVVCERKRGVGDDRSAFQVVFPVASIHLYKFPLYPLVSGGTCL